MKEAMFYDLVSQSCHACPEPRALRSGGGKPLTRRLAALAVAAALMTGTAVPAFADVYDIRKGSITIVANGDGTAKVTQNETVNDKDDDVKVTGSNEVTGNTVDIINNTDNDLKVTLSDVTITDPKGDAAPVSVSGTGNTAIELDGSNTLKSSGWHAGLERNEEKNSDGNVVSGKLTIQDEDKNGSLDATGGFGGAGIGGANIKNSGALEITGGTINASSYDGSGIGSGDSAKGDTDIKIKNSNVTAKGFIDVRYVSHGTGIGSGLSSSGKTTIDISGGTVKATGSGDGYKGSAGIGSGSYSTGDTSITLRDGVTVTATGGGNSSLGGGGGAGIGSGSDANGNTTILIEGATKVTATGGSTAAGIGSGHYVGDIKDPSVGSTTITIRNSDDGRVIPIIEAKGGSNENGSCWASGAGIGSGGNTLNKTTINIEGGEITATGGVTCPTARLTVIMMPNQTGSQLKWAMMGSMKGRKT